MNCQTHNLLAPGLLRPLFRLVFWSAFVITASTLAGCATTSGSSGPSGPTMYSFWPHFPAEPRVQFLRSYRFSSDIQDEKRSRFGRAIFGEDANVLPIAKPYGVAMWHGKLYICDIRGDSVVVLDLVKRQTRVLLARGLGGFRQPVDICIDEDGRKYVADIQRGVIFVFDADDRSVGAFGWSELKPTGVAVGGDRLYVADFASQSVQILDRLTGERIGSIGGPGPDDGGFVRPLGIAVNPDGNLVVSDVIKCRVQVFSPSGELIRAFGEIGDSAGTFVRPKHLAIDRDGIMYIVDAGFQNVQMFDRTGRILMYFGSAGSFPGGMNLPAGMALDEDPADVALFADLIHPLFDAKRLLIVTNQFGVNKVSVYAMGTLKPGATPQDLTESLTKIPTGVQDDPDAPGSPTPVLGAPESTKPGEAGTKEQEGGGDEEPPGAIR